MANEMKRTIKFLLFFALIFVAFTVSVSAYDVAVTDEKGNEYYHSDYRLYLPSHISPSEVTFLTSQDSIVTYTDLDGNEVSLQNGQKMDVTPYKSPYFSDPVYVLNMRVDGNFKYLMIRFATSLPSVYLTMQEDVDSFLKYNSSSDSISATFFDKNGTVEFIDTDGMCKFKVRGNATKDYLKKPFQIKLPTRANLYNMGSAKTWLLLANYDDQSLLRNSVMYKIGEKLGMQTCDFRSIDLFINGEYYGVYLLCEKVQIGKNRLEIAELEDENDELNSSYALYPTSVTSGSIIDTTNLSQYSYIPNVTNPSDITGGYLIELDNNYYSSELCYFTTDYGNHYVVKSPEYASRQEVEYIATLFADMEEAIMSSSGYNSKGKHYSEYIDIDSFASAYIMQEFGRNYDAGSSSMYFYKDKDENGVTSKIYKGPLWDCDNTLGNIHKNGASSTTGYWAKNRSIWAGLTSKPEFNLLVSQKFAEVYDYIFDMIDNGGFIDNEVALIGDSIYMEQSLYGTNDYSKWPLYYDGTHYDRWQSSQVFNFVAVYSQGNNKDSSTVIGYLCEHIEQRANWLAREWGCDVELRERYISPIVPDSNDGANTSTNTGTSTNIGTSTNTATNPDAEVPQPSNNRKGFFEAIWYFIESFFKKLFAIFE